MTNLTLNTLTADQKVFIISLPRTGTTSACLYFLNTGLRVAHTAFHPSVVEDAQVIADTPVFIDYPLLQQRFPNSKFIYLQRDLSAWIASAYRLLKSMRKRYRQTNMPFHPEIDRCFQVAFPNFDKTGVLNDIYLNNCYNTHKSKMLEYFSAYKDCLLIVDIEHPEAAQTLHSFLFGKSTQHQKDDKLPQVNIGRRINYWEEIEYSNKIDSFGSAVDAPE